MARRCVALRFSDARDCHAGCLAGRSAAATGRTAATTGGTSRSLRGDDGARDRGADGGSSEREVRVFAVHLCLFHFEVVALANVFLMADLAGGIARVEGADLIGVWVCAR